MALPTGPTHASLGVLLQAASSSPAPSVPSPKVDGYVDSLRLPLPPLQLHFAAAPSVTSHSLRYLRKGTSSDAKPAVVGKGGFGTVYRFERDDSFTPPDTVESNTGSLGSGSQTLLNSGYQAHNASSPLGLSPALTTASLQNDSPVERHEPLPRGQRRVSETCSSPRATMVRNLQSSAAVSKGPSQDSFLTRRSAAPAVVIVKVCRTPASGVFDEMPKTGEGRRIAQAADAAVAKGDTSGFHTRVVRGEARLFRFLQIIAKRQSQPNSKVGLVRMLADLPFDDSRNPGKTLATIAAVEGETGPVPRILAFERLVDLDDVLTSKGWQKRKRVWTHREVEEAAREIASGLAFLHGNHIVHGDLKPSNVMRDVRTGMAKIIDLGASRRFVCVPNIYKESPTAIEEFDRFLEDGSVHPQATSMVSTEGLGSLTGSPNFMAPEVLLQAGRYVDHRHISRSVLDDYVRHKVAHFEDDQRQLELFDLAYSDFKRGWGIKSDIWSWGCTVLSLLLRLYPTDDRPPSNSVCAFSFNFDVVDGILQPRHRLHRTEQNLPRFHEWSRRFPLQIVDTVLNGIQLPQDAQGLSKAALSMLQQSLTHQDERPSAQIVYQALLSETTSSQEHAEGTSLLLKNMRKQQHRISSSPSIHVMDVDSGHNLSHAHSVHNVDGVESRSNSAAPSFSSSGLGRSVSNCSALNPCDVPRSQADMASDTDSIRSSPKSVASSIVPGVHDPLPEDQAMLLAVDIAEETRPSAEEQEIVQIADEEESAPASTRKSRRNTLKATIVDKTRNAIRGILPANSTTKAPGHIESSINESTFNADRPSLAPIEGEGVSAQHPQAASGRARSNSASVKARPNRTSSFIRRSDRRSIGSSLKSTGSGPGTHQPVGDFTSVCAPADSAASASANPTATSSTQRRMSLLGLMRRGRGASLSMQQALRPGSPSATPGLTTPAVALPTATIQITQTSGPEDVLMDVDAPAGQRAPT